MARGLRDEPPHAAPPVGSAPPRTRVAPNMLFFPAATLHGAIVLPWSVLAMVGVAGGPAALATPYGHAHEMLLGYALAAVAGNQLAPMRPLRAFLLFGTWLAARLAFVALPGRLALVLDAAFVAALAMHVAPRLFWAAKKLRNRALPVILTALCVGAIAFDGALAAAGVASPRMLATALVLLLGALMLFMGGRFISAIAAGEFHQQNKVLAVRVQPAIEAALLVTMAIAIVSAVVPGGDVASRLACAAAGALALVRLLRWRLWACRGRPDLLCLGAGYAWLALGLLALAGAPAGSWRTAALHLVTVGALGTLTLNVMANTLLLKARRAPARQWMPATATTLVGCATLLRVAAVAVPGHAAGLLVAAALCWAAACAGVCWLVWRCALAVRRRAWEAERSIG